MFFSNDITGDWVRINETGLASHVSTVSAGQFNQIMASNPNGTWLLWHRYIVGEKPITSDTDAKIWQAIASLMGNTESGIVAYAVLCGASCTNAEVTMRTFVEALGGLATLNYEKTGQ